jgi:hypothetical protein
MDMFVKKVNMSANVKVEVVKRRNKRSEKMRRDIVKKLGGKSKVKSVECKICETRTSKQKDYCHTCKKGMTECQQVCLN